MASLNQAKIIKGLEKILEDLNPDVLRPLIQVSQLHQISKSRKRSLSSPN